MRTSQAKRKIRCSGGGDHSDVVSLPFSVGRPLYTCKGRKKKRAELILIQGFKGASQRAMRQF